VCVRAHVRAGDPGISRTVVPLPASHPRGPNTGIGLSRIEGVGVIAMRDIPKGTNPFRHASGKSKLYHPTHVSKEDIADIPEPVKRMLNDFFSPHDGLYYIPKEGLNTIDISFYLNHSDAPNLTVLKQYDCDFMAFRTNRDVRAGEELTISYVQYGEDPDFSSA
jgi:SET domain-containing protein